MFAPGIFVVNLVIITVWSRGYIVYLLDFLSILYYNYVVFGVCRYYNTYNRIAMVENKARILIVDDKEKLCRLMVTNYRQQGYEAEYATSAASAIMKFKNGKFHLVLLDLKLGADNGIDLLREIREINPKIPVIMITGYGTICSAVEAMKIGAYDYVQKPVDFQALCQLIKKALSKSSTSKQMDELSFVEMESKNREYLHAKETLDKFAPTDLPILIMGESGVGKEHLADYIHQHSLRRNESLLKINCSSFSESLLANELFGHEQGSYTGAERSHQGIFEQANKGTLFLDEIGDMPLSVQVRILRTLQNSEVRRIGAKNNLNVDVRIIAATNKNLESMIEDKQFRLDLFYRLNSVIVRIPSLAQRVEDLPMICDSVLQKIAALTDSEKKNISEEVLDLFRKYPFPGNIRELENILNYAHTVAAADVITKKDLPPFFTVDENSVIHSNSDLLQESEKDTIIQVLLECKNNKKQAAQMLGISRSTLYSKLEKYDIVNHV